eukprot:11895027-Ditylum_brightwellii.AAC.2
MTANSQEAPCEHQACNRRVGYPDVEACRLLELVGRGVVRVVLYSLVSGVDFAKKQSRAPTRVAMLFFTSSMVWVLLASMIHMESIEGVMHLDNVKSSVNKEGYKTLEEETKCTKAVLM